MLTHSPARYTHSAFTCGARVLFPPLAVRSLAAFAVSAVSGAQTGFKSFNLQKHENNTF